ncbi:DUF397 domain-containing protein [Amycolatopsis sp., V23-08]|uniref:DUF397 domain-containing protein n=1 Tax=Amycolatopsis heterodermiae TaxID=3110235 RepID=A0ABU5RKR1_9PSEU|nr:DUF397 domain-containing protein [Amycolatopsis sp., V23-08]MEA5366115.1 DUF397 domain-containing protein [Amycolatopsis sp., V23-08]
MIIPGGSKTWRVSSYSQEGNNCVEVAIGDLDVDVRDTKDRQGGQITLSAAAWRAVIDQVRQA